MTLMAGVVVQIESYPKAPLAVKWDGNGNIDSEPIDTEGYNLTGLLLPDNWAGGATISFFVAEKGEPETAWPPSPSEQSKPRYRQLRGATGSPVQVTGVVPGTFIALSALAELKGMRYIIMRAATGPASPQTAWATRVQYVQ
jgi:hypothetical protein